MNLILNGLVLLVAFLFAAAYLYSLILNLFRALKVNKVIKESPNAVTGRVVEIIKQKSRVFVKVEYVSTVNRSKFIDVFELTYKEFNDQYYEGQEVKIYYPETKNLKRVNCFPTYLEGQKIGLESGPLFTDIILFAGGVFVFVSILSTLLTKDEATGLTGLQWNGRPLVTGFDLNTVSTGATGCFQVLYLFVIVIFYMMLFTYLLERIAGMTAQHKQSYLKICGLRAMAEVKTFKFGRSKNAQGQKESQMKIEFCTSAGEKVACDLSSFLYTETQEQYVDILYDEKNPKNVVYMRK